MRYVLTAVVDGEYTDMLYRTYEEAKEAAVQLQNEGFETFGIERL